MPALKLSRRRVKRNASCRLLRIATAIAAIARISIVIAAYIPSINLLGRRSLSLPSTSAAA